MLLGLKKGDSLHIFAICEKIYAILENFYLRIFFITFNLLIWDGIRHRIVVIYWHFHYLRMISCDCAHF